MNFVCPVIILVYFLSFHEERKPCNRDIGTQWYYHKGIHEETLQKLILIVV